MDRDIRDVNTSWAGLQFLMYTSRITVGINFDISGFDCLFVYGTSWSCTVRDVFQSTMRVRYIKDKAMYYSLYTDAKHVPTTLEGVKGHIALVKDATLEIPVKWETPPAWLVQLAALNMLEKNVHSANYRTVFNQYLDTTGYVRKALIGISREALPSPPNTPDTWAFAYDALPDLNFEEARFFRDKICSKSATSREKALYKRYVFQHRMEESPLEVAGALSEAKRVDGLDATPESAAEVARLEQRVIDVGILHAKAWAVYCSERAPFIDRLFLEKNKTGAELATELALLNPYAELVGGEPVALDAIHRVCAALGLASTHDDGVEIQADVIVAAFQARADDVALLREVLGVRDQSKKTPGAKVQGDCALARDAFSSIFAAWSGAKVVPVGARRQKTVGGKRVSVQNYAVGLDVEIVGIEPFIRARKPEAPAPADPSAALTAALENLAV